MDDERATSTLSPAAKLLTVVAAVALVVWFLFAWLFLNRHLLDAAGESVGTGLLLALVVSVVGSVRRSR